MSYSPYSAQLSSLGSPTAKKYSKRGRRPPRAFASGDCIPFAVECPWADDDDGCAIPAGTLMVSTDGSNAGVEILDTQSWCLVPPAIDTGIYTPTGRHLHSSNLFFTNYTSSYTDGDGYFRIVAGRTPSPPGLWGNQGRPWIRHTTGFDYLQIFPQNRSRKVIHSKTANDNSVGMPTSFITANQPAVFTGFNSGQVQLAKSPGFRRIRGKFRYRFPTGPMEDMCGIALTIIQARVDHGAVDVTVVASDVSYGGASGWTLVSLGGLTDLYERELVFEPTAPAGPNYWYTFAWRLWVNSALRPPSSINPGATYVQEMWASPRVDIPLWFSCTGTDGIAAPGGLPANAFDPFY